MRPNPLPLRSTARKVETMKRPRTLSPLYGLLICLAARAEPTPAATAEFNAYTSRLQFRLAQQHRSPAAFLVPTPNSEARLRSGELIVEEITPSGGQPLSGALLHHWRGTAFAPGAHAADFERLMRDFSNYPQHFAPEVLQAKVLDHHDDRFQASMRVRQHHVITVVMDSTYNVDFGRLDSRHGYSISQSTQISEIAAAGTPGERTLNASKEHGFLWRLNTYWSYEERDGGLYMQVESVSLSRSIPRGLGWAVRPFVESVPRESLEFTLRSACTAISTPKGKA